MTLPFVIERFDRAGDFVASSDEVDIDVQAKKLSAVYQFIRAMPMEYIESSLEHQLEIVRDEKLRLEQMLNEKERQEKRLVEALRSRESSAH